MIPNEKEDESVCIVGSLCQIYSNSKKKWFEGEIIKILNDEEGQWLEVKYGKSVRKQIQRFNKNIRNIRMQKNNNNNNKNHYNGSYVTNELCKYFNSPFGCARQHTCRFKHIMQQPLFRPKHIPDDTIRLYSMRQLYDMKLNIGQRQWQILNTEKTNQSITISQFNCLAQSLCEGGSDGITFTFKCDPKYLVWEYRCKRILFEILQYQSDIICLTEIDKTHFYSFYKPNLALSKYDGVYLMKNKIFNEIQDGVAIFWNRNKITSLNQKFQCILGAKHKCCQVALGVRLKLNEQDCCFDVWNTHLKAGITNECESKRVQQCQILMSLMQRYSYKMPTLLCGDLNLHFDDVINDDGIVVNNKAYKLLTSGVGVGVGGDRDNNDNRLMFKSIWNNNENRFSVYAGYKDGDVKACFDYIMVGQWSDNKEKNINNDLFVAQEVLSAWKKKDIERFECRLPNQIYPSDHFLVAAKFGILNKPQKQNKQNK